MNIWKAVLLLISWTSRIISLMDYKALGSLFSIWKITVTWSSWVRGPYKNSETQDMFFCELSLLLKNSKQQIYQHNLNTFYKSIEVIGGNSQFKHKKSERQCLHLANKPTKTFQIKELHFFLNDIFKIPLFLLFWNPHLLISLVRPGNNPPVSMTQFFYNLGAKGQDKSISQSVQFSHSVMSDSLWTRGRKHASLPCPSPTSGACSNSCPSSRWCHPTISASVIPFSFCLQSFPASGSFQMSQFFASGGQIIGVSASASDLPMNIQDWFPLGWNGLTPCSPRDSQESSPTPQFKSISSSALRFLYGPSLTAIHDYWKNHSFD